MTPDDATTLAAHAALADEQLTAMSVVSEVPTDLASDDERPPQDGRDERESEVPGERNEDENSPSQPDEGGGNAQAAVAPCQICSPFRLNCCSEMCSGIQRFLEQAAAGATHRGSPAVLVLSWNQNASAAVQSELHALGVTAQLCKSAASSTSYTASVLTGFPTDVRSTQEKGRVNLRGVQLLVVDLAEPHPEKDSQYSSLCKLWHLMRGHAQPKVSLYLAGAPLHHELSQLLPLPIHECAPPQRRTQLLRKTRWS